MDKAQDLIHSQVHTQENILKNKCDENQHLARREYEILHEHAQFIKERDKILNEIKLLNKEKQMM